MSAILVKSLSVASRRISEKVFTISQGTRKSIISI